MEGKQGSGSRNLAHLCPYGCRVKNRSLVDRRVSARKPDASTLPRHRNAWLPSCRSAMNDQPPSPIRDVAAALLMLYRPKRLCQRRSDRGALIPRIIALDTLSVRERFGCFDHPSSSQPLQSWPVSLLPDKPRQSSTDLAADWRRSSLYRPAAQLRARTIGHGGHSCRPHPRDFRAQRWQFDLGATESTFSKSRAAYRPRDPARWVTWAGQNCPQPVRLVLMSCSQSVAGKATEPTIVTDDEHCVGASARYSRPDRHASVR